MKTLPVLFSIFALFVSLAATPAAGLAPQPPAQPVKLIFIHHSTGENWLSDGYGNLGITLAENNYFVSDTNYGWGPESIGDRTDIPNWTEWFRSEQTSTYMAALFNESEQHASYTCTFGDPGGENVIILFKSCFPNSALEGSPNDSPDPDGWLSVGHAKYVYNEILQYFATRPEKLFIVITAPPLSEGTYAQNARAFNHWLLNNWLAENNYTLNNVAVFDFYNILTSPDAHHRYVNGQVEHIITSRNTLAYPSGDDHPSELGSRKATEEFIGMLNFYYQRWLMDHPPSQPLAGLATVEAEATQPAAALGQIDDFETASGWQAFTDGAAPTTMTCASVNDKAKSGTASLQIDFEVAPSSWATCSLFFNQPQNWSAAESLAFELMSGAARFNVDLYVGPDGARETYVYTVESLPVTSETWVPYEVRWEEFHRVAWEENAGAAFTSPEKISGIAFGFNTDESQAQRGVIWIDDLHLSSRAQVQPNPKTLQPTQPPSVEPSQPASGLPFCGGATVIPLALIGFVYRQRRRKNDDHCRHR